MTDAMQLLHQNLHEVFAERDPERRRTAIERTYSEDVTFIDPEGEVVGRYAVNDGAQKLLDGAPPNFVFEEDGLDTLEPTPPHWRGVSGHPEPQWPAGSISSRSVVTG